MVNGWNKFIYLLPSTIKQQIIKKVLYVHDSQEGKNNETKFTAETNPMLHNKMSVVFVIILPISTSAKIETKTAENTMSKMQSSILCHNE